MTPNPTTRASLLLRLKNSQDHQAWIDFVLLYEPVVYRLLRRSGLQDADSRELLQELFLTVSRNIERWAPTSGQGSFRAWLRRVTRNLLINWLKQRQRHSSAVGGSDFQFLLNQVPAAGPEGSDFDYELRRALFRRASEVVRPEIAPKTWTAFWETGVLGASAAVTAQKLGMTAGAVRVAKCRVVARLQVVIAELEMES